MIDILIADDHPLLLDGLEKAIDKENYSIVEKCNNGKDALNFILTHEPALAILDIEMPLLNGLNVVKECSKIDIKTKFIILTYHKEPSLFNYAKGLPIQGYLLKEDVTNEINACIKSVLDNKKYLSKSISEEQKNAADAKTSLPNFTPSEKKILKLLILKLPNTEIADRLFVSTRTIEKHRSNIAAKLQSLEPELNLSLWSIENKVLIQSL